MKFAWVYIPFFACAGFMAGLLVENPMSLGTMALVTLAITIERLTPEPGAHGTRHRSCRHGY